MQELLMLMGAIMPTEAIVEEIKNHSTEYTLTQNEETLKKLESMCMLLLSKRATGGTIEGANDVIKKMKKSEKAEEVLNYSKT